MRHVKRSDADWTRREAIAGMVASSTCASFSSVAAASGTGLPDEIVQKVRNLSDGRALVLRMLVPTGSGGNIKPVVQAFRNLTGVAIELTETQVDDINTELTLHALGQSNRFDLALPATFGLPDLASVGAIQPLTEFARVHEPQGFRQAVLYQIGDSFDGQIYGFQTDGDAYLMFYNKSFLQNANDAARYADKFGYPLDTPTTWSELDRQMAFFNRPAKGQWGGLLFRSPGYLAWEWWARFHAKGVWPFSSEMEPQIASEAGILALEEMIRATASQEPSVQELGLFENWKRYARGDIYCNIGWGGTQKFLNGPESSMGGNLVFGPMPGGIVDGALLETPYFNWGWNYVVPYNSSYPEIAYLFALFASTAEMSTLAVRQKDGFFDPFRPEHYEDAGIRSAYSAEFLDVHRRSLEGAIPDLYLKGQSEYFRVLNDGLHRALSLEAAPRTALERIERRWQAITESNGLEMQIKRWERLKQKYPARARRRLKNLS